MIPEKIPWAPIGYSDTYSPRNHETIRPAAQEVAIAVLARIASTICCRGYTAIRDELLRASPVINQLASSGPIPDHKPAEAIPGRIASRQTGMSTSDERWRDDDAAREEAVPEPA